MGRIYRSGLTGKKVRGAALFVLLADWAEEGHTVKRTPERIEVFFLSGAIATYVKVK